MANKTLRLSLLVAASALAATSALAEETRRGDGRANRAKAATQSTTPTQTGSNRTPANRPQTTIVTPAPVVVQPVQTTSRWGGWFGGGSTATPGIDRTQDEQARQIAIGQRRGTLTDAEVRQLNAEQARIGELERRAKADGRVTYEERAQIRHAQRDAEQHIWEESHDRERAFTRHYGHRYGRFEGWRRWWW